jgi:hypothetical protein
VRRRHDSKIDPTPIVRAHFGTFTDGADRLRRRDLVEQVVLPIAAGTIAWWFGAEISATTALGALTLAGLFSAFLFGLSIQLLDRSATWADTKPDPGPSTSSYANLLAEMSANAGYASLVAAIAAAACLAVAITSTGWQERVLAATVVTLLVHLGTTLLMVARRTYLLTAERLLRARTGVDRDSAPP